MVKKTIIFCVFIMCFFVAYSEDYSNFIHKVLSLSPVYQNALLEHKNAEISLIPYKYRWLPRPFLDTGYNASLNQKPIAHYHTHMLKTAFVLFQDIPGGITMQAQAAQFFARNNGSSASSAYEFSGSFALTVPLYAAAPDLLPFVWEGENSAWKIHKTIADIQLKIEKKQLIAEAVFTASRYLLLKERIALEERRQDLQKKEAEADEQLWSLGRLSSFELTERNTKRYESYLNILQMRQTFANLIENLYVFGLEEKDMPQDIHSWLLYWERYTSETQIGNGLSYTLETKQLARNFYEQAEKRLDMLPKLHFSAEAEPVSSQASSHTFKDSVLGYWKNTDYWNWNFSIGMRFALSPLASEYRLTDSMFTAYRIYDITGKQLFKNQQIKEKQYQTNIGLLKKLSEKALLDKIDADNKIVTAKALLEQGHLNQLNFEYQLLNAEIVDNTYKEVRLRYITAVLNGY